MANDKPCPGRGQSYQQAEFQSRVGEAGQDGQHGRPLIHPEPNHEEPAEAQGREQQEHQHAKPINRGLEPGFAQLPEAYGGERTEPSG